MSLHEAAAKRFPQPVRVGDLIGRTVLRPLESQNVLGHVVSVIRAENGGIAVVVDYGGLLGIGGRDIAVPVDAMTLLGDKMEIIDLTPAELDRLPTHTGPASAAIPADETIKVGLSRPSH